ncbi:MAG TPA: YoaK family protein [Candidatus Eisenbacteria bacterium]|nr:YoaK family protein [Candidatus Eisenbacteria bacterium]
MAQSRPRSLPTLGRESMLLILALAAGSVDAISYLGLGHVFTAMMTGNIVLLGLALAQGEVLAALRSILALIGFAAGVFIGAVFVERESGPREWPIAVTRSLAVETSILALAAAATVVVDHTRPRLNSLLIVLFAVAMGMQSAAVRRLGVPGIATTYITGTLTTLVVDLLGWLRALAARLPADMIAGSAGRQAAASLPWEQRVGLLAGVVGLYCFGALAGGLLQLRSPPVASLLPFFAIALVVANAAIRHRRRRASNR